MIFAGSRLHGASAVAQLRRRGLPLALAALAVATPAVLAGCGGSGRTTTGSSEVESSTSSISSQTASSSATRTSSTNAGAAGATLGRESRPGRVTASAHGLTVTMRAGTHAPRVNAAWPISFSVGRAGTPVRATLTYEYMFGGAVVAKRPHRPFAGHVADVFRWPASSVGYPLTFRAVLVAEGTTFYLDYRVKVAR